MKRDAVEIDYDQKGDTTDSTIMPTWTDSTPTNNTNYATTPPYNAPTDNPTEETTRDFTTDNPTENYNRLYPKNPTEKTTTDFTTDNLTENYNRLYNW